MPANFMQWKNPGTALITGASAGLGAEFARQLAAQGFNLVLTARREERLRALAEELGKAYSVEVDILVADHSVPSANERVVDHILNISDLDVLVNNAGYGLMEAFTDSPTQAHVDMISVHCTAPTQFAHTATQCMKQRGRGVIINVSSIGAFLKNPPGVMYTSTKEYINVFSETLQAALADTEIRVQSLCPGFTYTEFHDVETMSGFDRNWFPKEDWMTAEEVVSESLAAFEKTDVLVITGERNQDFVKQHLDDNPRFNHSSI
jgi:short-subunit dehydrogenase